MGALRRRTIRAAGRLLWPLLYLLLRLLIRSWRIRLIDAAGSVDELAGAGEPRVLALWHSDLLPCGALLHRRLGPRCASITGLVSGSADGEILARVAAGFGFHAIRGSTSRGGLAALRNLYREIKQGRSIGIAPDGPRGPARVAQTGIVQVAMLSGVAILPVAAHARRAWRARSWDRMVIPKPFAEVVLVAGELLRYESGADVEREAKALEGILSGLSRRAEQHAA